MTWQRVPSSLSFFLPFIFLRLSSTMTQKPTMWKHEEVQIKRPMEAYSLQSKDEEWGSLKRHKTLRNTKERYSSTLSHQQRPNRELRLHPCSAMNFCCGGFREGWVKDWKFHLCITSSLIRLHGKLGLPPNPVVKRHFFLVLLGWCQRKLSGDMYYQVHPL